jgi:hypothetical protein
MAKYYGAVGYAVTTEVAPGVYDTEVITERKYTGDVLQATRRGEQGEHLNDDLNVTNRLSIVADAYAYEHVFAMRYAEWMGVCWKVNSVEIQHPRLILNIGGVYNGPRPT